MNEAVAWYRKAAERGTARPEPARRLLRGGAGVPKDLAKAVEWYLKSTRRATRWPCTTCPCVGFGKGVPVDRVRAQQWLTSSGKAGFAPAQQQLTAIRVQGVVRVLSAANAFTSGSGPSDNSADNAFREHIRQDQENFGWKPTSDPIAGGRAILNRGEPRRHRDTEKDNSFCFLCVCVSLWFISTEHSLH